MLATLEKEFTTYGFDALPKLVALMKVPQSLNLGETVSMTYPLSPVTRPSYKNEEAPFGMVLFSLVFY
jgi:hypothetical protein